MKTPPELQAHREWLGQIAPVGLVVSPHVLVKHNVFVNRQDAARVQAKLIELMSDDEAGTLEEHAALFHDVLDWPATWLAGETGGPALPDTLTIALPDYADRLFPTYAIPAPDSRSWLALIKLFHSDADFDKAPPHDTHMAGWRASPQARFERLLRETGVPVGLLVNATSIRLVHAPKGESSGHLTFRFADLVQTQGRPMAGALYALLSVNRVTDLQPEPERLPALLRESRRYQNEVSTALSGQVLEALWDLVRGFDAANEASKGLLLGDVLREARPEVYGGLLTTLMRLVFVLYAEDRDLMPRREIYTRHYSLAGLFERLRDDASRYPDTMDARFGAWAQLLALFRLIHDGGRHGDLHCPARHGRLFDPDAYPFLEGRPHGTRRVVGQPVDPPRVSDGVVYRVLRNLLVLEGERLSYRALDVEQIGSVYEAMMGFALEEAHGPSLALSPKHIVVNLADLIDVPGKERAAWLRERAELTFASDALSKAASVDELETALAKKRSRYTAAKLPVGALYLQPTEERRRSGSHYTPRTLTEPIVRTTFGPVLDRLGADATPEQILDLKVCDPAMGSGAFLVEACRLLADRLVIAWDRHKATPKVPDDEDAHTFARRLVAERCLYGVDKNVFAVDLAKLSLWLATLAREHPFTFLDHSLRHGDSLVGLSREQIACFNWDVERQLPLVRGLIDARVGEAQTLRQQIQGLAASDDVPRKSELLRDAEDALADVRLIGDAVVSAFFERDKPKERATLRASYAGLAQTSLQSLRDIALALPDDAHPISPFHWEIEFPEVFTRANPGFDVFIGNPPFAGKNTMAAANRAHYPVWLQTLHEDSHGNADLVAHFYRRAFNLLRTGGAFGLIATNTIAQGDTRGTGLRWIRHHDGTIFAARKRVKWPGEAAVVVSVVHVHKGLLAGPFDLDGQPVERITAFLFHAGGDDDPARLQENANKSFQGSIVLGMGFTFDDTDKKGVANPLALMRELIKKDPRNAERIFPYIGGEEVNDSPTHAHHRYVINFEQMSEAEARRWPDLMDIVERKVRPERMKLAGNPDADRRNRMWWQWGRYTPALYGAIRGLERVLVAGQTSKYRTFVQLDNRYVFDQKLIVFSLVGLSAIGTLQSRAHEAWALFFGSTLEDRPVYTPSDCFETFPFPPDWETNAALERAGAEYYAHRAKIMVAASEGLTKTYNRFHDRDEQDAAVRELRRLHDAMDRVVLDAYGWTDIRPVCDFFPEHEDDGDDAGAGAGAGAPKAKRRYRYRWPDDVRDDVLGRLLELNAERAKAEAMAGSQSAPKVTKKGGTRRGGAKGTPLLE